MDLLDKKVELIKNKSMNRIRALKYKKDMSSVSNSSRNLHEVAFKIKNFTSAR